MIGGMLARIKVLLKAAPARIIALAGTAVVAIEEGAKYLPTGWQDNAVQIGGIIAALLLAAQQIVRRVTPVDKSERGLLK